MSDPNCDRKICDCSSVATPDYIIWNTVTTATYSLMNAFHVQSDIAENHKKQTHTITTIPYGRDQFSTVCSRELFRRQNSLVWRSGNRGAQLLVFLQSG